VAVQRWNTLVGTSLPVLGYVVTENLFGPGGRRPAGSPSSCATSRPSIGSGRYGGAPAGSPGSM
jgi:hypothetical protein